MAYGSEVCSVRVVRVHSLSAVLALSLYDDTDKDIISIYKNKWNIWKSKQKKKLLHIFVISSLSYTAHTHTHHCTSPAAGLKRRVEKRTARKKVTNTFVLNLSSPVACRVSSLLPPQLSCQPISESISPLLIVERTCLF